MNIEFLSTLAVIAPDPAASRKLYVDALGLPLESHGDDYHHSEHVAGCKSFGIWPLSQAAEACLGTSQWPAERPVPRGHTVARLQSPEGAIVGIPYAPVLHDQHTDEVACRCAGGWLRGQVADYLRRRADVGYSGHVRARVERPGVQKTARSIVQSHWRAEKGQ